jgi:hypothetical protein
MAAPAPVVAAESDPLVGPVRPVADPMDHPIATNGYDTNGDRSGCTPAQMRRFIKSRPWIPMHELRRRFLINGSEDEVTPIDVDSHRVFVGLPEREGRMLGELLRVGDVGYELALDPGCPVVVGVYPMRPVARS